MAIRPYTEVYGGEEPTEEHRRTEITTYNYILKTLCDQTATKAEIGLNPA